jgi:hypothetical protein
MLTSLKKSQQPLAFSFWLITALFLLLYLWTLSESVPVVVQVQDGLCTALLHERSSQIPCSGLDGGEIGLYLTPTSLEQKVWNKPLDFFVPGAAWQEISMTTERESGKEIKDDPGVELTPDTSVYWPAPEGKSYKIQARLSRLDGQHAGILLLQRGRNDGWLFQVDSEYRQAVWRKFQNGQPSTPIVGVPYQKPPVAQVQYLLRKIIGTFFGALAIILMTAVLHRVSKVVGLRVDISALKQIPDSWFLFGELVIVLSIFAFTLWIAVDLLERLPHVQDSITYLFQAQTLARRALWAPEPPIPEAFVQKFLTVWDSKWFGQYPPGYPAILAVGVKSGAPWLVNPWLSVLTAILLVKLGTLLYRSSTGLLAGGLAPLSPFFIVLSGSLMVHAAELFWALLTMVGWTLALRAPYKNRWAVLSGASLGMLLLTRQITAVAIGASFVAFLLLIVWRMGENKAKFMRQVGVTLFTTLPFFLFLLGYQTALTGSPWQDPRLLSRPFDVPGFGSHIGEMENTFELQDVEEGTAVIWYTDPQQPPRGHSPARDLYNTEQNLEDLARHLFGWSPLIALAFCWTPFLLGQPQKYDWVLVVVLLAIIAVYVAYWTTGIMYGPRYYYAALPALFLLTARGLQMLKGRFGVFPTAAVFITILVLALFFYWPQALLSLKGYNFIGAEEKRLVEEQVEKPALVFIPTNDWWDYGRFFSGNTPWLDSGIIYARDLGGEINSCLQQSFPDRAAYLWQPGTKSVIVVPPGDSACPPEEG